MDYVCCLMLPGLGCESEGLTVWATNPHPASQGPYGDAAVTHQMGHPLDAFLAKSFYGWMDGVKCAEKKSSLVPTPTGE